MPIGLVWVSMAHAGLMFKFMCSFSIWPCAKPSATMLKQLEKEAEEDEEIYDKMESIVTVYGGQP